VNALRGSKASAYFLPLFLPIFFVPSTAFTGALHAQAPAAGASVAVRTIDPIDSSKDPAGKQYRASVTNAVDAGNGVTIPQGSVAAVTLTHSGDGSGWTTQLVSVTINGQPVAVTGGSASVAAGAQTVASHAVSSLNSMLGGFGHHVSAPAAAIATGQRVLLPPGTALSFVLSQPPAVSPASQPLTASSAPAPNPASGTATAPAADSAGGPVMAMEICFSNPPPNASDLNHKKEFLTGVFEVPVDTLRTAQLDIGFAAYLKATYQYPGARVTCQPIWSVADAKAVQKKIATDHAPNVTLIDTGWRYGQQPVAQGQSGFDPITQGPGGLDLSQHRLTTYYCKLLAPGGTSMLPQPGAPDETVYISPIFQADWDSDTVSMAFQIFMGRYVHDLSQSNPSQWCWANHPALLAQSHPNDGVGKLIYHKIPVDFTYTTEQAAASHAAAASANAASLKGAAALGPNQSYAFCYSDPRASVIYFSDIFGSSTPPAPGGSQGGDQAVGAVNTALEGPFQAFLKKKYGANGSATCRAGIAATELPAAQALKKRIESNLVSRNRVKIVETGWSNQ